MVTCVGWPDMETQDLESIRVAAGKCRKGEKPIGAKVERGGEGGRTRHRNVPINHWTHS